MIASTVSASLEQLSLDASELAIVRAILAGIIPHRRVWAFGSRTKPQKARRFSDLDLAVEGTMLSSERADLNEAFDESDLTIRVDLLELDGVDGSFRDLIEPDFTLLQDA